MCYVAERRIHVALSAAAAPCVSPERDEQPGVEPDAEDSHREPLLADSEDVDLEGPDMMKSRDVMWLLRALRDVVRELLRKALT